MKLGFVSAILPEMSLEDVFKTAAEIGYDCVEVMCWPKGEADRRYAGVTHIDLDSLNDAKKNEIESLVSKYGVEISGLGYYPNVLSSDQEEAEVAQKHLSKLIDSASDLGVPVVNTFVGRNHLQDVDDNWPRFVDVWESLLDQADQKSIKIAIENCPMLFDQDQWPGGKNLASNPTFWKMMFQAFPTENFGLNFDPSHFIWLHMDYVKAVREFGDKIFHVHAKDARLDQEKLDQLGILSHPNSYHTPKLPGLGDVDWGAFFSALTDTGFNGAVCVEVEDRAYEGTQEDRIRSLKQSYQYLKAFVV